MKSVQKNSAASCFFNLLLGVWSPWWNPCTYCWYITWKPLVILRDSQSEISLNFTFSKLLGSDFLLFYLPELLMSLANKLSTTITGCILTSYLRQACHFCFAHCRLQLYHHTCRPTEKGANSKWPLSHPLKEYKHGDSNYKGLFPSPSLTPVQVHALVDCMLHQLSTRDGDKDWLSGCTLQYRNKTQRIFWSLW